uniref:Uncharacterized protein n=1 Tax=Panagrolaimus superbus TaxID=310955 RepID=A0A914YRU2_9BILA
MKITPEFQSKVQSFLSKDNFKNCNHSSWLTTDISKPSIIDINRCYTKFEYGRVVYETFKSSTLNSSDKCNIDHIEVYPCYSKNATDDPMNIFGVVNLFLYTASTYAFNSPVQKYALIDKQMQSNLFNRNVFSAAFFFQCPKCDIVRRTSPPFGVPERKSHSLFFEFNMTAPPIPNGARRCPRYFRSGHADLDRSRFVKNVKNSFSRQVFPFKIVKDKDFV